MINSWGRIEAYVGEDMEDSKYHALLISDGEEMVELSSCCFFIRGVY